MSTVAASRPALEHRNVQQGSRQGLFSSTRIQDELRPYPRRTTILRHRLLDSPGTSSCLLFAHVTEKLLEQPAFTEHADMKAIRARVSDQKYSDVMDFVDDVRA